MRILRLDLDCFQNSFSTKNLVTFLVVPQIPTKFLNRPKKETTAMQGNPELIESLDPPAATQRQPRFWDTNSGFKVTERYRAWAEYTLGLPSDSDGGGTGAQLGKRSDLPANFMLAMDVEITLKEWGNARVGKYILHVYGKRERSGTMEDPLLQRVIGSIYKNPVEAENEIGRIVDRALLSFGQFMATRRGL